MVCYGFNRARDLSILEPFSLEAKKPAAFDSMRFKVLNTANAILFAQSVADKLYFIFNIIFR